MKKPNSNPRSKMILIGLLHFTAAAAAAKAAAMVNVREGSFTTSATDLDRSAQHASLKIERVYNSRSSASGLFGFGWCSSLETSLRHAPNGRLALQECGAGAEVIFKRATTTGEWRAENAARERLLASPGKLTRLTARGEVQTFDALTGRLIGITDRAGRILELSYSLDGRLVRAGARGSPPLRFHYARSSEPRVTAIDSEGLPPILYRYRGTDLSSVESTRTLEYEYDDLHNLMVVRKDGHASEEIAYDRERDRVLKATRIEGSDRCTDNFTYRTSQAHLGVDSVISCESGTLKTKHFDFWYGEDRPGATYLSRMRIESENRFTELSFDSSHGRLTAINRNGTLTRLAPSKELL